ncbi:hypothetical protein [Kitasatospora xanthocidica]|uniref:hypothetical protein n=1 Tax=Kitasatospora xanthocidica TaxID=83382 RepID=UPI00167A597C|nr:hypothetical protein [Kitasatospora xanthocidica]
MTSTASHSATPPHGRRVPGNHGGVTGGALFPASEPAGARPTGSPVGSPAGASSEGSLPVGSLPAGGGPWSVRSVGAGRGRAALELYQHGELADVLVAARLTPQLLRGARRCPSTGRARHVLAWGRLPADGTAPSVVFTGRRGFRGLPGFRAFRASGPGRSRRAAAAAEVVTVAGRFWLAWAEGPFDAVLVEHPAGGGAERLPLERVPGRRAGGAA